MKFDTDSDERSEAVLEAWNLAVEGLKNGKLTLSNGKVVVLSDREILRHIQWLAMMGKIKPKSFPLPKDIYLRTTSGSKGSGDDES